MTKKAGLFAVFALSVVLCGYAQDVAPDAWEPDSRTRRVSVQEGEWVSRTITASAEYSDEDWFTFTPASDGFLVAETSGDIDTVMELYDGVSRIAENDDGGNANARIEYLVEGGVAYSMMVRGYGESVAGPYRFRVTLEKVPQDDSEPNDTPGQATFITLGGSREGFFLSGPDIDWYRLTVPAGGGLLLVYTTSSIDTLLELYDGGENQLAEDDDSGGDGNARLSVPVNAGTVYIRVSAYNGQTGRYALHTELLEPAAPDRFENDDAASSAWDIQIDSSQERNFTSASDEDWVRLRVTREGVYDIRARGIVYASLDTYLELFDRDENLIEEDDDGGESLDAYIVRPLTPGLYFIRVTTVESDPIDDSSYTLSVNARIP
jgi:hypothetical protein